MTDPEAVKGMRGRRQTSQALRSDHKSLQVNFQKIFPGILIIKVEGSVLYSFSAKMNRIEGMVHEIIGNARKSPFPQV
jgi:hypothetical protein